ncbi:MAG: ankyrin repeat domain-containing protein, partial [Candidatus Sericytochromatia bacterium]|nr:ankyrin repeat domain-containing protein [Candidatus Sericytochromatia bacterium]
MSWPLRLLLTTCLGLTVLASGVRADNTVQGGDHVLLMAAQEGMETLAERRLGHGASIESQDALGRTPLILAARNNHLAVVRLLLRLGADAAHTDLAGHTAVSWAVLRGHVQVTHAILGHLKGSQDYAGQVYLALQAAKERGDEQTAEMVRTRYGDIDTPPWLPPGTSSALRPGEEGSEPAESEEGALSPQQYLDPYR